MTPVDLFIHSTALIVQPNGVSHVDLDMLEALAAGPDGFAKRVAQATLAVYDEMFPQSGLLVRVSS